MRRTGRHHVPGCVRKARAVWIGAAAVLLAAVILHGQVPDPSPAGRAASSRSAALFSDEARRQFAAGLRPEEQKSLVELKSRAFTVAPVTPILAQQLAGRREVYVMFASAAASETSRALLQARGARTLGHVTGHTWRMELPGPEMLLGMDGVVGIEPVLPADKLSVRVWRSSQEDAAEVSVVIRFVEGTPWDAVPAILESVGAHTGDAAFGYRRKLSARLPAASVVDLAALPDVGYIDFPPPPDDLHNNVATVMHNVDDVRAPPYNLSGAGVNVMVRDTVVFPHVEFGSRLTVVQGGTAERHGTHVSGTIGGDGSVSNNATGMAPAVNLFTYNFRTGEFEDEVTHARDTYGARLSNHSYGARVGWNLDGTWTYNDNTELFGQYNFWVADSDALIRDLDVIVVRSAGNDGDDTGSGPQPPDGVPGGDGQYDCLPYEAVAKNVVTIGAIDGSTNMADFSSFGPTDDGRVKPDLVARGVDTFSLDVNNGYATIGGTSMSTPTVCGATALLLQQYAVSKGGQPPAALVKALLLNSAVDLFRPGPDYQSGWGMLDIKPAVDVVRVFTAPHNLMRTAAVGEGVTNAAGVTVTYSKTLRITLAWTDMPGEELSAVNLVNDLDLFAVSPSAVTHYPFAMPYAQTGGSLTDDAVRGVNTRDNVEQIVIDCPEPGYWSLRVTGSSVPIGPQPYALVAHGDELPERFEPNDTLETAAYIGVGPGFHLRGISLHCDDEDYYRFRMVKPGALLLRLHGHYPQGFRLLDAAGVELDAEYIHHGDTNAVITSGVLAAGSYHIKVYDAATPQGVDPYGLDVEPADSKRVFYVNVPYDVDPAVNSFYTLAPGSDYNDGLTPYTPKATVADVLADYALASPDLVVVDSGEYAHGTTITVADEGADYAGAMGVSLFDLDSTVFSLNGVNSNRFYHMHFMGDGMAFDLANADSNRFDSVVVRNHNTGIRIADDAGSPSETNVVVDCAFTNTGTAILIENSPDNLVISNRIDGNGSCGVQLVSGWSNSVLDNLFVGKDYAMHVTDGDRDVIRGNVVKSGGPYGIYVDRAEQTVVRGNTLMHRTYGAYVIGASGGEAEVLFEDNVISNMTRGIYLDGDYTTPCEVRDNRVSTCSDRGIYSRADGNIHDNEVVDSFVGIYYDGAARGVYDNDLHDNTTGLSGRGLLGGADWSAGEPNDIHDNDVGVGPLTGATVQYNRIHDNEAGISANHSVTIHHNVLYDNPGQGILVDDDDVVSIVNNTVYNPTGDCVRVIGGSTGVSLHNNILWAADGYCLYVANDSQVGFDSDYNNFFATGSGELVWWQKPFTDLVDWQIEANLDNHSIGSTVINPTLDNPLFVNAGAGDFRLSGGSTSIDAGDFDTAYLDEPAPNGNRVNLGAYGGTAVAAGSPAASVSMIYPDYYTDWPAYEVRTIQWTNVALSGNADIDLYREGVGKVVDIATVPLADGSHEWNPGLSSILGHTTNRYRIRVTAADSPSHLDESREPFSIPISGTDYYVNDGSTVSDVYCTAVGGNRKTGMTPGDPKANVIGTLRSYALGPGDTVWVDRGYYHHVRNVTISASPGLGDDEGMVISGPNLAFHEALIDRGNPFDEATTFDLNDADFVTMRHLNLTGGNLGILLRNGSDNFSGSHLVVSSNSLDGIRIEAGSAASVLHTLAVRNNGENGIAAATPIGTFSNCVVYGNGKVGIELDASGDTRIEGCWIHHNDTGIKVANELAGTVTMVGHSNLTAKLGNVVYSNAVEGIHVEGNVAVYGNTVYGQDESGGRGIYLRGGNTSAWNVVHGNTEGIGTYAFTGTIEHNRVYNNTSWGIRGDWPGGTIRRNVVYSNDGGIHVHGRYFDTYSGVIANNIVYHNVTWAIRVENAAHGAIENNTIYADTGNGVEVGNNSHDVKLRNNMFWANDGAAVHVALTGESGFDSDYNLFHLTGSGHAGYWQATPRPTLTDWKNATFGDASSFTSNPRFVDPDGADGSLGGDDGEDDDFHLQSPHGSFHGGSHAPVLDGVSGLPVYAAAVETADALLSAAIDRGDDTYAYGVEPAPNGAFVNLGAYGNTDQASKSPAEYVTVLGPSGGESWPAEQAFLVRWRSHDTNGTVNIELFDGAVSALVITNGTANDGEFLWQVPGSLSPSANYTLVITRNGGSAPSGTSAVFIITGPVNVYYVNDGSNNVTGDWTTAPGNDANDGLTPATPKASVRNVLEAYDLGPGDVVRVDDGDYVLSQVLLVTTNDSGARIEGYYNAGLFWRRALFDRNNSSSDAVGVDGADGVELVNLHITGGQRGVHAYGDSDGLRVQGCTIYGNDYRGIYVESGCDSAVLSGNRLYGIPAGDYTDDQDRSIHVQGDGARILGNWAYDSFSSGYGLYVEGEDCLVEGNEAYGNWIGIQLDVQGTTTVARQNTSYSNTFMGISAYGNVRVEANTCHSHRSASLSGIHAAGADVLAVGNVCYNNDYGVQVQSGARAEGNRVYDNGRGIYLYLEASASGNRAYSNQNGIYAQGSFVSGFEGVIENNLAYSNATAGIHVYNGGEDTLVGNNTVFEPVADAIALTGYGEDIAIRNNILCAFQGHALSVEGTTQDGLYSDYNLFFAPSSGHVGWWAGTVFDTRSDWFFELGLDGHSLEGDPLFVDPDGPDNVLGYDGVDHGVDDDFHLQASSPAIDQGTGYYLAEPRPNGDRVNLGAYGNTAEAATSPDRILQVLYPNGLEKFEIGEPVTVSWRSAGFTPASHVARINVAGETEGRWLYSRYQTESYGGSTVYGTVDLSGVLNPAPPTVYVPYARAKSGIGERIAWVLPVPDGNYTLRLHFVEPSYDYAGARQFDIVLQGAVAAAAYDIYVASGAEDRAVAPSFPVTATAGGGISIALVNVTSIEAVLSAIEVLADNAVGPIAPTVSVDYSANMGGTWNAVASGVPLDAEGEGSVPWTAGPATSGNSGLIRVQGGGATELIEDTSDLGFLVSAIGTAFYINDRDVSGDLFTTAPGDNLNSGRTPGSPMLSLNALLGAYDLDPGDTIRVDNGSHTGRVNLVIGIADAGVRIEGPPVGAAVIDRANTDTAATAIELVDADDVELVDLHITGGYLGIDIADDSDNVRVQDCRVYANKDEGIAVDSTCDAVLLTGNVVFGIPGGSSDDNQPDGFTLRGDDARVLGNAIYDSSGEGIDLIADRGLIEGNVVYNCTQGVTINGQGDDESAVHDNVCYGNSSVGIKAVGRTRVSDNTCYGQDGFNGKGIEISGANVVAAGNTVHGNRDGIVLSYGRADYNRVYNNLAWGVHVKVSGYMRGNRVYANQDGVYLWGLSAYSFSGVCENNLVYANATDGIRVEDAGAGTVLRNNTVYEPAGNALELREDSRDIVLRNNILCVDAGIALNVTGAAQAGLDCDYNLYHATGTGVPASWGGTFYTNWLDWALGLGHDRQGRFVDPLFVDPDGADNVLGYDEGSGVDRGLDDDFHLALSSPAVDRGDPLSYHLEEALPSGDRNNVGAYGNTPESAVSPPAFVQVLFPNGYEKFELGENVQIRWHTAGISDRRVVARMNTGGPTIADWLYDRYQTEVHDLLSSSDPVDSSAVSNPAPEAVYQRFAAAEDGVSNRLEWTLPVPDGSYTLVLHFVEPWYDWAGARVFDINLQGVPVTANFDIYAAAGVEDKAVTQSYAVAASGGSGIQLEMVNLTWEPALLCALELTAQNPGGLSGAAVDVDVSPHGTGWTSIATNVPFSTGGGSAAWVASPVTTGNTARVRVTVASAGPLGIDPSDHGFLVGPGSRAFYVNDHSTGGDVYTSAVGDDANDGRTPGTPMAGLGALLTAYDLGPGDMVFVDVGDYTLPGNVVIESGDSGVTVRGPSGGGAVLNRSNTVVTSTAIELDGAADVELRALDVTGAYRGLWLKNGSSNALVRACRIFGNSEYGIHLDEGCRNARIVDNTVYGIDGGAAADDQDVGIYVLADDAQVANNLVYDGISCGVEVYAGHGDIASNTVYGFETGIEVTGNGVDTTHVHHNTVHHNEDNGIHVIGQTHVTDNVAYGHTDSGRAGVYIYGINTEAHRNICYDNYYGVYVRRGLAANNRAFYNSAWGIYAYDWATVARNKVYSNDGGIIGKYSYYSGTGFRIENNVVYDNANDGIRLDYGRPYSEVVNNTVYAPVGSALVLAGDSRFALVRNNILWVDAGYCLYVESSSQASFDSDYNVFYHTFDPNAHVGYWNSADQVDLPAWQAASGVDANSVFGHPKLTDRDGADDVLGYSTAGNQDYDGGVDDNLHLAAFSPAIDRADEPPAPPLDADGNARSDDDIIPNLGTGSGVVDIGAYEFPGLSRDTNAPIVTATDPGEIHAEGIISNAVRVPRVSFSEALDSIDAVAPVNYELLLDSDVSGGFDGTDTAYVLAPVYVAGSTQVVLYVTAGSLPDGLYQFTIQGDSVRDLSGVALDGDDDSLPGGDYVRVFAILDPGFVVGVQAGPAGVGSVLIQFDVLPGFNYYVDYRDSLTDPPDWQPLPGEPHNTGSVADILPAEVPHRFYRLRRVPQ